MATSLTNSMDADADYFQQMINLIPTSFLLSTEDKGKLRLEDDSSSTASVDQKRKRHKDLTGKQKWKKQKFDAQNLPTIFSLHDKLADGDVNGKVKKIKQAKKRITPDAETDAFKPPKSNLEELQERFRLKLDSIRSKRKAKESGDDAFQERRRLKRRESKLKMKLKKRSQKQNQSKNGTEKGLASAPAETPAKKIRNKEGKLVFSKFDFQEKRKTDAPTGKNYEKLLEIAEKRKQKMEKLKQQNPERAKDLESKDNWKNALQRAEGVKVKDKPELLEKSLKKREKRKDNVRKQWQKRDEQTQKRIKEAQDKRQANLNKRKQGRIDKKVKRGKKKGHIIPGF